MISKGVLQNAPPSSLRTRDAGVAIRFPSPHKTKTRPREAVAFWKGRFAEILRVLALALISAISADKDERSDSHASVRAGSE